MDTAPKDVQWRKMQGREREILNRLLGVPFPGRDELLGQLDGALVGEADPNGSLRFKTSGRRASTEKTVPIDGVTEDEDGTRVEVLLFLKDGMLDFLEVYRADLQPLTRPVSADRLRVPAW